MYHYVRDLKNSKFPDIKGLDLQLFNEQLLYLQKHYHLTTIEEVIYSLENETKLPAKSVLLTFDDAYIDHYENVLPLLDKYKLQGSFYAPIKAITEHTILDVNKIHFILASVEDKTFLVNDLKEMIEHYSKEFNLESFEYYYKKLAIANRFDDENIIFIKRLLQVELNEHIRNLFTDMLFEKYIKMEQSEFSKTLYMSKEQIQQMKNAGMHIGNHGYNHYWWDSLPIKTLENEIDISTEFLQSIGVNEDNFTACYPYGAYNENAINLLEKKNYKLALSTKVDIAKVNKESRFILPRLDTNDIPKDKDSNVNEWYNKA
jgi:peptidoglycan/xylan/chitin deacetylase (PgdA/CDA1 family)